MLPVAKCAKCQGGASGPVGHLDLFLVRMSGKAQQFKCATCATLWTRTNASDGSLAWSNEAEEMKGMAVPGWKPRSPKVG
jgi:hypothetical protein